MVTTQPRSGVRQRLGQLVSLATVVVLTVCTTLLVQRLLGPTAASAGPAQTGEIRATSFVLVRPDGTEIGRLGPGSQGAGNLTLFDTSGRLRIAVSGAGDLLAYGSGGTALAQVYANADDNTSGLILRDSDGKVRLDAAQSPDANAAVLRVHDEAGNPRVGMGSLADPTGASSGDYGLRVRDAGGGILTTVP